MNTETPVIVSAVRTPIGKFQGGLAGFSAPELGAKVVAEAIRRADLEARQVDEVIMGNVVQAGLGQNPARQAALKGGCQPRVAAMTINKVCGSGLKAVALAAQAVELGESEIVVAGGMESMSNCPYLLLQARTGYRLGDGKLVDSMINDGLWDGYENFHMGMTGEVVAEKYRITREEQDRFAVESHQKAVRARKSCFFEAQILRSAAEEGRSSGHQIRRIAARGYFDRNASEAEARVQERWNRHGGKRAGHQRRRCCPDGHERAHRVASWQATDRAHRRAGRQRRRAQVGDDGAGRCRRKAARKSRLGPRQRRGPRRAERSLCRRGDCRDTPAQAQS